MIIQNLDVLKSWLTAKLEPICDADPAALAKYVAALVKKDKSESDLVDVCIDQLEVFLGEKTAPFVQSLFDALKTNSYLSFGQTQAVSKEIVPKTEPVAAKKDAVDIVAKDKKLSSDLEDTKLPKVIPEVATTECEKTAETNAHPVDTNHRLKGEVPVAVSDGSRKRHSAEGAGKHPQDSSPGNNQGTSRDHARSKYPRKDPKELGESVVDTIKPPTREVELKNSGGDRESGKDGREGRHSNRSRTNSSPKYSPSPDRHKRRYPHKHRDHRDFRSEYRNRRNKEEEKGSVRKRGRCKDYEEKGYCIFGESCPYDHGKDPVIVNDINFGMELFVPPNVNPPLGVPPQLPGVFPRMIPNSTSLPLGPNPLQPPLGSSAALSLNTGVNLALGQLRPVPSPLELPPRLPYFPPRLPAFLGDARHRPTEHLPDKEPGNASEAYNPEQPLMKLEDKSKLPVWSRLGSAKEDLASVRAEEDLAQRELVTLAPSVKTNTPAARGGMDVQPVYVPASMPVSKPAPYQRRPFQNQTTLEIRKIPQALNNVVKLSEYFQKFGKIVNVQVKYDNDPEAALVQFESNAEARRAYTCPEAVFGNRFIKTFWHKGYFSSAGPQRINPSSSATVSRATMVFSQSELPRHSTSADTTVVTRPLEDSALVAPEPPATVGPKAMSLSSTLKLKTKRQREALKKRLEIQKQRQTLMGKQIQEQKALISKLEKNKKLNAADKEALLKAVKTITANIDKLRKEIEEEAKATHPKTKQAIEKELLDYEMDLFHKMQNGEDSNEMRQRIDELRLEAKALGIRTKFSQSHSRGIGRGRRRSGSSFSQSQTSQNHATIDHRPRQLLVTGFDSSEKEAVMNNFKELGDIERMEDRDGGKLIVVFHTRKHAEQAVAKASTFPGKKLSLAWYLGNLQTTAASGSKVSMTSSSSSDPTPPPAKILRSMSRTSVSSTLSKDDERDLLFDGDEKEELLLLSEMDEDEEEDEERSWRR